MTSLVGKYLHVKNENLEEYFKAIGVPYIARKMMGASHPSLEIAINDDEQWTITSTTLFRTIILKFKLGEEYEENMPGGVIKNISTVDEDKLVTKSIGPNNMALTRIYEKTEAGLILTYKHESSGIEAKRHFKKVENESPNQKQ